MALLKFARLMVALAVMAYLLSYIPGTYNNVVVL